jgi:hypothetical protein
MNETLLQEILMDKELSKKYKITKEMISKAKLSPPYDNKLIEYLAVIIKSKMIDQHGDVTLYNKIKNLIQ